MAEPWPSTSRRSARSIRYTSTSRSSNATTDGNTPTRTTHFWLLERRPSPLSPGGAASSHKGSERASPSTRLRMGRTLWARASGTFHRVRPSMARTSSSPADWKQRAGSSSDSRPVDPRAGSHVRLRRRLDVYDHHPSSLGMSFRERLVGSLVLVPRPAQHGRHTRKQTGSQTKRYREVRVPDATTLSPLPTTQIRQRGSVNGYDRASHLQDTKSTIFDHFLLVAQIPQQI